MVTAASCSPPGAAELRRVDAQQDTLSEGCDQHNGHERTQRSIRGERKARCGEGGAEHGDPCLREADSTGLERDQTYSHQVPHGESGADPRDDARGVEQSVDQPCAGGDREPGEGILGRTHDADSRQKHDDASGDHARRVHLELRACGGDRDERGDEAPCRVLVERRDAVRRQEQLGSVDSAGRQEREQAHQSVAAQGEGDASPHHPPAEGHRPAVPEMAGGHDPGNLVPCLVPGDVTGHQVLHGPVDLDQVRVVDRAPAHPSHLEGGGLVTARLVAEGEVHPRHVCSHVAYAAGPGHPQHGGRHVSRSGARRQQDLTNPQRKVEGLVHLAPLSHGRILERHPGSRSSVICSLPRSTRHSILSDRASSRCRGERRPCRPPPANRRRGRQRRGLSCRVREASSVAVLIAFSVPRSSRCAGTRKPNVTLWVMSSPATWRCIVSDALRSARHGLAHARKHLLLTFADLLGADAHEPAFLRRVGRRLCCSDEPATECRSLVARWPARRRCPARP